MEMQRNGVLVIEDHPGTLEFLMELLADAGYAVTGLDSGLGAVGLARQMQPRTIVLDLGLPFRSGVALLGDLKADPATAGIPVVVVSAYTEMLPAARAKLAAAVLGKPFDLPAFLHAVHIAHVA